MMRQVVLILFLVATCLGQSLLRGSYQRQESNTPPMTQTSINQDLQDIMQFMQIGSTIYHAVPQEYDGMLFEDDIAKAMGYPGVVWMPSQHEDTPFSPAAQ